MPAVNHLAFIVGGSRQWAKECGVTLDEAYAAKFGNVRTIITACVGQNIPVMTFLLLPMEIRTHEQYPIVVDSLVGFVESLPSWRFLHDHKVKVSVLGHWYNLPGRLVDPIKKVIEDTKDYDSFFLNLCLNYDGRQEIVDAARLLSQQVKAGKIDVELIRAEMVKENVYTSGMLPPDIIVKTGASRKLNGFLLWDSVGADIIITGRPWQEFTPDELERLLHKEN